MIAARYLPLGGMVLFFLVGFAWREWWHRRRFGQSGVMLFRSGIPTQIWRDSLALGFFFLSLAQAVIAAVWPAWWQRWSLLETPLPAMQQALGAAILFGGIALLVIAQRDLGNSWRIGIEEDARPGFVSKGLFRFCRNPIFFAVIVVLSGYAILLPTWLSAGLWIATVLLVRRQVQEEEAYLRRAYPNDFSLYARQVGRFLPGLGRLKE